MTILQYCSLEGITQAEFARRCGMSESAMSLLVNGKRVGSGVTMRKVVSASGGKVGYEDMIGGDV